MSDPARTTTTSRRPLIGKVVVVTGAARGLGAAQVAALASAGATVIATDVLDFADPQPDRVTCRQLDVTSPSAWGDFAKWIRAEHGAVHGLVNNAGIAVRDRLPNVRLEKWHQAFDVNVTGPLLAIQSLVPFMTAGSSIVNICSIAAVSGHAAAAYTASKWALRGLTRSASLELGERGIRVNAVMPGLVQTPLMAAASPAFAEAALAEIPLARAGSPTDIAPTIVFLMTDDASYYNGAEIVIDGGMTAHVSHKRIADATKGT